MATFMTNDPDTSANNTLSDPVQGPESNASIGIRDGINVRSTNGQDGHDDNIMKNMCKGSKGITTETVSWDSITDLLDGEIGDLPVSFNGFINHSLVADADVFCSRSIGGNVSLGCHGNV